MPGLLVSWSLLGGALLCSAAVPAWADEIDEGKSLYNEYCANCHGRDMSSPGLAFDLRKFPLSEPERFRQSVLNGKGQAMPAWKAQLSGEDVQVLWAYVKSGG